MLRHAKPVISQCSAHKGKASIAIVVDRARAWEGRGCRAKRCNREAVLLQSPGSRSAPWAARFNAFGVGNPGNNRKTGDRATQSTTERDVFHKSTSTASSPITRRPGVGWNQQMWAWGVSSMPAL